MWQVAKVCLFAVMIGLCAAGCGLVNTNQQEKDELYLHELSKEAVRFSLRYPAVSFYKKPHIIWNKNRSNALIKGEMTVCTDDNKELSCAWKVLVVRDKAREWKVALVSVDDMPRYMSDDLLDQGMDNSCTAAVGYNQSRFYLLGAGVIFCAGVLLVLLLCVVRYFSSEHPEPPPVITHVRLPNNPGAGNTK